MGFKQSLVCPKCSYDVLTSGGPDMGFGITTNTFCCTDCKILLDLKLESKEFNKPELNYPTLMSFKIKPGQKCRICRGTNFELWDNEKKSCPKCGTKMKLGGTIMNWD